MSVSLEKAPVGPMAEYERNAALYVYVFMFAAGLDTLRVDDENNIPSYALDYRDDDELDHSIAWLPLDSGIITNSTPDGGWNPVVRFEDLAGWLREN